MFRSIIRLAATRSASCLETMGICKFKRVAEEEGVGIEPSPQPDRIALDVSSDRWIVVSVVVVKRIALEVASGAA